MVVAITTMLGSALISYFYVKQHDEIIASLKMQSQTQQTYIRDIWSGIGKREERSNTAIILTMLPTKDEKDVRLIKQRYLENIGTLNVHSNVMEIIDQVAKENARDAEKINDTYLEHVELQETISELEQSTKFHSNLAIFLQILSVIALLLRKEILH